MADEIDLLKQAEDRLAIAKTISDVQAAHRQVRAAVRSRRRKDAGGILAQSYAAAVEIWDDQKEMGVSFEERCAGLEQTIRAAWPKGREWKYLCDRCQDYGWIFGTCTPDTPCGRPFTLPGQRTDDYTGRGRCAPGHSYARACHVCEKGEAFRRGLIKTPKHRDDDLATVGKSKQPTRFGR